MAQQQFLWFKIDDLALHFLLIGLALVCALLAVFGTCLFCCWRRRNKRQRRVRPVARLQKIPEITVEEAFSGLADANNKVAKQLFSPMDLGTKNGTTVNNSREKRGENLVHDSPLPPLNGGDYLDIGTTGSHQTPLSNMVILNGQEGGGGGGGGQQQLHTNGPLRKNSGIFFEQPHQQLNEKAQQWSLKDRPFTILIDDEKIGKNQKWTTSMPAADQSNGHILLDNGSRKKYDFDNLKESVMSHQPHPSPPGTRRFVTKMAKVVENANEQIYGEFEALNQPFLSTTIRKRTTEAELPENIRKNRFYDTLPFEFNRVKLHWTSAYGGTDAKSDYINASYIRPKENGPVHWIAAQSPITKSESADGRRISTLRDFWEMIWQEGIDCIVMLEGGKQKFGQEYWPEAPGESASVEHDFSVHLYCVTEDEICVQREIWMERKGHARRKVTQWHFRDWLEPIGGPAQIEPLLEFVQTIRSSTKRTPVLVHCSTGAGRTGIFIALDLLFDKLQKEQIIDVKETVAWLRTQRIGLVHNVEQYMTIYEAVALAIRRKSRSCG